MIGWIVSLGFACLLLAAACLSAQGPWPAPLRRIALSAAGALLGGLVIACAFASSGLG